VETWRKVDADLRYPIEQFIDELDDIFQGPARAADRERILQEDIAEQNRKAILGKPANEGTRN
jgi:hypothetical protein